MLDDEPNTLKSELAEIDEYLENKHGLELKLFKYEEAQEMIDSIDQTTDIAFIDKNLKKGTSGVDVIKCIRRRYPILDIFIYSRAGIKGRDLEKLPSYGLIGIAQRREQIVDRLETLIDKNLSKWEDVVFLRGVVISRLIDLERDIDDVLMEVFLPSGEERQKKFRDFVLENSYIPLVAKRKMLSKIADPKDGKPFSLSQLDYLLESRNMLAHCKRSDNDPNMLIKMGENQQISSAKIKEIFASAEHFSEGLTSFKQVQARSRSPASP